MTLREREVLGLISKNPLVSQKDIAETLGITRSSVAVHITNLMKKGHILGKGYLLPETKHYVCVIGGANMDIQGFPSHSFHLQDSNPGNVKLSYGGVGRNIGENLTRLGCQVKMLTALGKDTYGDNIIKHGLDIGLDMSRTLVLPNQQTSTYLSILDDHGDMHVAIADMAIMNEMTVQYTMEQKDMIANSNPCVIDTNLPEETIQHLLTTHKDIPFFVDTVSTEKAKKIKNYIGHFHTLKPNKYEVEMLTGIKITSESELIKAATLLLNKGVQRVFITLGEEGVFYANHDTHKHIKTPPVQVVNATGAGDAFTAGLVYGYMHDYDMETTAKFSMGASILALKHADTINPYFSEEKIYEIMEEL